jgi:hypothetical protein
MTSQDVKEIFAAHGLKVRVRDLRNHFRICPVGRHEFPHYLIALIANAHGFTNVCGLPIDWASFNGYRELSAYKPGAIVRI